MKKIYILIIAICLGGIVNAQEWQWLYPKPQGNDLFDITFIDINIGYAVGEAGAIIKTSNSGLTWTIQTTGTLNDLKAICFADTNTGYTVGLSGTILKTADSGLNWVIQNSGSYKNLNSLDIINSNTVYIVGDSGIILKTTNGGINWTSQTSGTINNLNSICFINADTGWIVGSNGIILKTTNGGINWISSNYGATVLQSVSFIDANIGYAINLSNGRILKTTNGGATWSSINQGNPIDINSMYFCSADIGYAVGGDGILKTTDGGLTWSNQNFGTWIFLSSVYFINEHSGFAVGWFGSIYKTINGGLTWIPLTTSLTYSNLPSVYFINENIGYTIMNEAFLKTSNGGLSWQNMLSGNFTNLNTVLFINADTGFVSRKDTIYKTTNGGNSWIKYSFGTNIINKIFFINSNIGYAVGNNGTILKTINGGISWSIQNSGTASILRSVYFLDINTGYAVGNNGTILKTINGGTTWSIQNSSTIYILRSVYFLDINTGYAVGDYDIILKTNNGGTTWSIQNSGISSNLMSVYFSDNNTGYAVGSKNYDARILKTTNGGITWNTQTIGIAIDLNCIHFPTPFVGYAVGRYGAILKIEPNKLISDNNKPCEGTPLLLFATSLNGASYSWSGPNGFTSSQQNPIVSSNSISSMSGKYFVTSSIGSNIQLDSTIVLIKPVPLKPISGNNGPLCVNSALSLTASTVIGANYFWTGPNNFSSNQQNPSVSNSVTMVMAGTYKVTANLNGCESPFDSTIVIVSSGIPSLAGISGLNFVCQGVNNITYSVPAISNAISYIWTLPTGATGTSTTNTITVNYSTSAVSGSISVYGVNSCGNGASSTLVINVDSLIYAATSITGLTSVCQGQNNVIYTIPSINNATSYNWTLPAGATGISSTNSIIVDYGSNALSGNITVYGSNSCGNSNTSTLPITVNSIPLAAGIISGSSSIIAGQQNVVYSIPAIVNATSHNWDLPIGTSINYYSGPTISINYSQSAASGNITVNGNNVCGDGPSSSLYIIVNPFVPNCSAQFDLVADTAVLHHYFVVNNASGVPPLQYNWSWGDGSFSTTAYPTHTYSAAGYYNICLSITDSVGCTVSYCDSSYLQKDPNAIISVSVIPQGTLGINSLSSDKIKIYPNPAKENLIIELIESNICQRTTISIYNIQGQLCRQIFSNQLKTEVDIKDLSTGLYVIKLNNEKESFVSKFVKE